MKPAVIFSKHAIFQMKERNISEIKVIAALRNPDQIIALKASKFQAVKMTKRKGKKFLLVVIFRKVNSSPKVITTFLTSKIDKYLK